MVINNQVNLVQQQPAASSDAVIVQQAPSVARPTMNGRNAGSSNTEGNVGKPCVVCGSLNEDMPARPAKSLYCLDHSRALDSLTTECQATDMKNNTEFMNAVKTMRGGGKSGPPSKFSLSRLIMEYQTHNPSEARRRNA